MLQVPYQWAKMIYPYVDDAARLLWAVGQEVYKATRPGSPGGAKIRKAEWVRIRQTAQSQFGLILDACFGGCVDDQED